MKIIDRWKAHCKDEMEKLLLEAEDQMTKQRDVDFVKSMRVNFAKWGVHTWLSDAQKKWLERIAFGEQPDDTFDRFNR